MHLKGMEFSSDKELAHALRSGDKRALEQVYAMCYATFESYVRSCGGAQAEEVHLDLDLCF